MKPFKIDDMYFEYKYETLLEELNIFNFSKFNELIHGFNQIGSNINSAINSINDICKYFCNSLVYLKYSITLVKPLDEEERNYYWVFYFHNITLHFLHTLNDLLYTLIQEYTFSFELKHDIGFKKSLVDTLLNSDKEIYKNLGKVLNNDVPVRTMKYRDEYTHNIMPYRPNSNPVKKNGGILYHSYSTMISNFNDLEDEINSDLSKIKKRAKKIKEIVGID